MQSLITTALMGFFLLPGGNVTEKAIAQAEVIQKVPVYDTRTVSITGYNAVPEQTDTDPLTTASGAYSNPEIVVARSVDLEEDLPFGTVVKIIVPDTTARSCGLPLVAHLIGYRVVADSMHPRKQNQLDVLFDVNTKVDLNGKKVNAARVLGVCEEVEVHIVGSIDIKSMPKTQTELATRIGAAEFASR